jgi:hypothetical protein
MATGSVALGFLGHSQNVGLGDWDLHLQWYEVIRQTVLRWHQVPWWNPFVRGGFPLAGEPQCGLVSIDTPLVLLFGTSLGLRIATMIYLMLAVEGARRLAAEWVGDPWAACVAGAVYGLNGAILVYSAAGHALTMSHPFLPWLVYWVGRLGQDRWAGAWLGLWSAASVLTVIQYPTAYGFLIAGVLWVRACGLHRSSSVTIRRLCADTSFAVGVFLALAGWRIVITGSVIADFPRRMVTLIDRTPSEAIASLWTRTRLPFSLGQAGEIQSYVGVVPVLLAAASLTLGWRWWHTLAATTFWLSLGVERVYQLSFWLRDWPGFSTMHVVTRWRLPLMLGVGLAASSELARLRTSPSRLARWLATGLVTVIVFDLIAYAHQVLPAAFDLPPRDEWFPGPAVTPLVNIEHWETARSDYGVAQTLGYTATLRGYGVIRGYEPQLGYDRRGPTARLWRGHPNYRGEFWTEDGPVAPVAWSPNRIVLRVRPGQTVHINQNPGSWWLVNGQRAFAEMRCAEPLELFAVSADAEGRLELVIQPPGLRAAGGLAALGVALAVCGGVCALRSRRTTLAAFQMSLTPP